MNDLLIWFKQQISDNDIFAGVLGGSVAATLLYSLKSVPFHIYSGLRWLFLRFFTIEVTLTNADLNQFVLVAGWLNTVAGAAWNKIHLDFALASDRNNNEAPNVTLRARHGGADRFMTLGYGSFGFWYKRVYVRVTRSREEDKAGAELRKSELLVLRFWTRNRAILNDVLQAAKEKSIPNLFTSRSWGGWQATAPLVSRSLDTVILPSQQKRRIVKDLEWFFENKPFFTSKGLSCARGYLFYGPPGTGKTTLVRSLASHFQKNLFVISLSDMEGDSSIIQLMLQVEKGSFVVIDDIDLQGVATTRDDSQEETNGNSRRGDRVRGVTLGGLLQILDGVHAGADHVIFLVTNRPEALDSALMRPGRIDVCEKIDLLTREDAQEMALAYFDTSYLSCLDTLTFPNSGAEIERILLEEFQHRGKSAYENA